MATRENRSRYNFGKLEVGDIFDLPPIDLLSMKNSLRAFNIKHRRPNNLADIDLKCTEVSASNIQVERIS